MNVIMECINNNNTIQAYYGYIETYSSKVSISLDGHGQLLVSTPLVIDDSSESLDEFSEDCCIHLISTFTNEERYL